MLLLRNAEREKHASFHTLFDLLRENLCLVNVHPKALMSNPSVVFKTA